MRVRLLFALPLLVLFGAAFAADDKKVEEGKPAPDVKLPAANVETVLPGKKDAKTLSLKDFEGKKNVVLFFYPKAMTKGCTIESCGFRDKIDQLAKLDTVVIGISTDKLEDQTKFTEKEKLNFPLLADSDKMVAKEFGVPLVGPQMGFASRWTFIIDKKGVVRKIYKMVTPDKHPDEVIEYIKENLK
jgi:thioredoxin-dependent peroxiredoxin